MAALAAAVPLHSHPSAAARACCAAEDRGGEEIDAASRRDEIDAATHVTHCHMSHTVTGHMSHTVTSVVIASMREALVASGIGACMKRARTVMGAPCRMIRMILPFIGHVRSESAAGVVVWPQVV